MKKRFLLPLGVVAMMAAFAAELVITSFTRDGDLTWTNSVSNATYRVEWASTAKGPWQRFEALTNLSSVVATDYFTTVKVPMFYRVVWTDPPVPRPAGDWEYFGYNARGDLVVTGRLSIVTSSGSINGSFDFKRANTDVQTEHPRWPGTFASGRLEGFELFLPLLPDFDDYFITTGSLIGDHYSGEWEYSGFSSSEEGTFVAKRLQEPRNR